MVKQQTQMNYSTDVSSAKAKVWHKDSSHVTKPSVDGIISPQQLSVSFFTAIINHLSRYKCCGEYDPSWKRYRLVLIRTVASLQ